MKKGKQLNKIITLLVEKSFREGRIIESDVLKAIKLLKLQPSSLAVPSLSEYLKQLKREERCFTMYVETAIPLSPVQIKKMKKVVEKKVKITKIITKINPEILGGFKLRVGDEIWDESTLAKINQVKEVITSGRSIESN